MKQNRIREESGMIALVFCVLFVLSLAGCVGYIMPPPVTRVPVAPPPPPPPVMVQPVMAPVAIEYDYLYYPGYEIYYSTSRREYIYLEGGVWVAGSAPRGISMNVVLASPSVRMDFRDAPGNHHTATVTKYPKNWKPDGREPNPKGKQTGKSNGKQNGKPD